MKRKLLLFILVNLILGFSINAFGQERFVVPIDEGKKDASFNTFRAKLITALKKKDKKYLISILDPNIKVSFGGDDGITDFKNFWEIDKADSKLWNELLLALNNGGKFINEGNTKTFCAPYSFWGFPDDLDSFEYNVIFGNNVRLRSKPDLSSDIITNLSYNIVKVDYENSVRDSKNNEVFAWAKIETLGGLKGFVSAEYVRSPIDYRACFEKTNGKWKMTAFVAGD